MSRKVQLSIIKQIRKIFVLYIVFFIIYYSWILIGKNVNSLLHLKPFVLLTKNWICRFFHLLFWSGIKKTVMPSLTIFDTYLFIIKLFYSSLLNIICYWKMQYLFICKQVLQQFMRINLQIVQDSFSKCT